MSEKDVNEYLSGRKLFGDDFDAAQIARWYDAEKEGYAKLLSDAQETYRYSYHALNRLHGFRVLSASRYAKVLGVGSAYGAEFEPILNRIGSLIILESSEALRANNVGDVPLYYVAPQPSGTMLFDDAVFDMIVCFGVLHHIPNVSYVVSEFARCLRPGGIALIREPIVSMGDWRELRPGLTACERGIPLELFRRLIRRAGLEIKKEVLCMFSLTPRLTKPLGIVPYNNRIIVVIDSLFCRVFRKNLRYHAKGLWGKIRPTSVFYVLGKPVGRWCGFGATGGLGSGRAWCSSPENSDRAGS